MICGFAAAPGLAGMLLSGKVVFGDCIGSTLRSQLRQYSTGGPAARRPKLQRNSAYFRLIVNLTIQLFGWNYSGSAKSGTWQGSNEQNRTPHA
jgi:hypothetical protein